MIFEGSRYENADVVVVDGSKRAVVERYPYSTEFSYQTILTQKGDRADLLANRFYGDPTMWWVIAYANPEVFLWDPIPVGVELRVPRVAAVR